MIAVAVAVIIGIVAVTCGIVADSNHADTLTFLGLIVKTTAAQIFLSGAICTWALFASLWLLSAGIRRSKERSLELRLLKAVRTPDTPELAGLAPTTAIAHRTEDRAMSAPATAYAAREATPADPANSTSPADDPADSEPTIDFADLITSHTFSRHHDLAD